MPDENANTLINEIRHRRKMAIGFLVAGVVAWVIAALIVTSAELDATTQRIIVIVSSIWLLVGGVASWWLASKNSFVDCPKCGKSFYKTGLFVGFLDPIGQKCSNCEFELRAPVKKDDS